jgi:hypothetical protein
VTTWTTGTTRMAVAGLMLWPAVVMAGVAGRSLMNGRPLSSLPYAIAEDPPALSMGLLIAAGFASSALLLVAAIMTVLPGRDHRPSPLVRKLALTGYALGSSAGLFCYFLVGRGGVADRGLELFVNYQIAGGLIMAIVLVAKWANRMPATRITASEPVRVPRAQPLPAVTLMQDQSWKRQELVHSAGMKPLS